MDLTLEKQLFATFATLVASSSGNAVSIAEEWGALRSQGGLSWSTVSALTSPSPWVQVLLTCIRKYRATVKRSGVFSGTSGSRDFNAELFEPISKKLSMTWELVFHRSFPRSLRRFARQSKDAIDKFQLETMDGVPHKLQSQRVFVTLDKQVQAQIACLDIARGSLKKDVVDKTGRTANRMFAPAIQKVMEDAYANCMEQTGES